jgi:hypothetical protein
MSQPLISPATARALLRFLAGLLALAILAQFFVAGIASVTDPAWWTYHKFWVGIFQWLVLPLPILAWFCGKPRSARIAMASLPIFQIALQYIFVHRALEGRLPIGVGLHALNAALMLLVAATLALGWLDRHS